MLLLDIILDPRRIKDTARVIKPVVRDTVSAPSDTTTVDTVVSTFNVYLMTYYVLSSLSWLPLASVSTSLGNIGVKGISDICNLYV